MKKFLKYTFVIATIACLWAIIWSSNATITINDYRWEDFPLFNPEEPDSTDLLFPFDDDDGLSAMPKKNGSPLYLNKPSNINTVIEYNPETNKYEIKEKIGDLDYRNPRSMTLEEYTEYDFDKSVKDYWQQKVKSENFTHQRSWLPKLHIGGEVFDRIFGSSTIDIRPQGSAELTFGIEVSKIDNPQLATDLRKTWTFDFNEQIQMNVTGQIGDKLKLATSYNTEASFDFENKMNLTYEGKEDEIIQKIEAGDVTLPLTGSLITGSQSLFGIKTELQFGKLTATSVFSQQKGKSSVIEVKGGAQTNYFEVDCDQYEANKHFFLAHYFKDNYNSAMANLPVITSDVNITKIEVWVTNKTANYEDSRNVLAFMDLAEGLNQDNENNVYAQQVITNSYPGYPTNESNSIFPDIIDAYADIRNFNNITSTLSVLSDQNFVGGQDYEKIESARKLSTSEYKLNTRLGFISLNSALNADEILAVAYEYTSASGETFRVGEFTNDLSAPSTLMVKLLKGTSLTPRLPTWNLMMKNVYALGAYQVNPEEFYLNIFYNDPSTGKPINYIPESEAFPNSEPIISLLSLDNLNQQLEKFPDGIFDFISGYTINPSNGRIYFPVLEPFGEDLKKTFGIYTDVADHYTFHELYDSTQSFAKQISEKNKFILKGSYQSSGGSDIALNALNVPQGSVVVTAGGRQLSENVDYTVDYALGRVKIINQGLLESGTPIKISLESNSLFSIQSKTLFGTHLNYKVNKDFNIGGTILHLSERPLTPKVNIGDEPISNTIWGLDGTYRTEAPWLTKLVDKLPFLETKEKSTITVNAEFAHLIPGHSKAIEKEGIAYIDDFEGSKTTLDIRSVNSWKLASVPQGQPTLFIGGDKINSLEYGFARSRLNWYVIDQILVKDKSETPSIISDNDKSEHYSREVFLNEIFPQKNTQPGAITYISVLNLAFDPFVRGPYNYNTTDFDVDGHFLNPEKTWGGIMRRIETNDFEASNIEYIEFWMMDPFADPDADWGDKEPINSTGGDLYFNLGNISEDILNDGRKTFENGLPTSSTVELVDTTVWGRVPIVQSMVTAFDNEPDSRPFQDVGLDGLNNDDERSFFSDYLTEIESVVSTAVYNELEKDPSSDDFHYFMGNGANGEDYEVNGVYSSILERYKKFNGLENNSPTSEQYTGEWGNEFPSQGTSLPDVEDINRDNNLSESESYFQYRVPLFPGMGIGDSYITDVKMGNEPLVPNGENATVKWYQFKVPIQAPDSVIGSIMDYKSIRFIRMMLSGFSEPVVLRFASLDLIRGDWRRYRYSIRENGEWDDETGDTPTGSFDISAVNVEENSERTPISYVLPPDIDRVADQTTNAQLLMNEQALVLKACDMPDGEASAAYKNAGLDVRQYKRLIMDVHAEEVVEGTLQDGDMRVFIRLGSDFKQNYYEYEIPLTLTPYGEYNSKVPNDREIVWPESNRFDFEFAILQNVKQLRNAEARKEGSLITQSGYMEMRDGPNRVIINGNPNLSDVRTIMIGIRNPKASNNPGNDDGLPKCVEVWLNELRLSDFDEKGGWAANARISARLADFGSVNIAGSTSRRGFGSIEKKVNERSKEDVNQYDISSNLELGKFFPEKARISIPMYVGYSETFVNPQYNPLDPDIPFDVALDAAETREERDSIKKVAQEYLKRKSINFTNVKVNSGSGKKRIYSLSNWGINYGYNNLESWDISTEYNQEKHHNGGIMYNFNSNPKKFEPFKKSKSKFMRSPWMRLIKDFNLNLAPNQLSFRTDLVRNYRETKLRDISSSDVPIDIPVTVRKDFSWNRVYSFKYDLTKTLKIDFNATNAARIDEPAGRVWRKEDDLYDPEYDTTTYQQWRDSVWQNISSFGRNTNYHQTLNASYTIPINKIPIFNWINANVKYRGDYDWISGPNTSTTSGSLEFGMGHTIKNSNSIQLTGMMNFLNLYNKVGYLKKVNQQFRSRGSKRPEKKKTEKVRWPEKGKDRKKINLKKDVPKTLIHKLGTDDVKVNVFDDKGKPIRGTVKIETDDKITFTATKDYTAATVEIIGTKEVKESLFKKIMDRTLKVMMGVKNLNIDIRQTNGSLLPGYKNETTLFGLNGQLAPGFPYVFGYTEDDFGIRAGNEGWLVEDAEIYEPFITNKTENITIRSSIEPINGLRIDVNANRNLSMNTSEYLRYNESADKWETDNKIQTGTFSMTFNTLNTAFKSVSKDQSETFELFKDYRAVISGRLADQRINEINEMNSQPGVDIGYFTGADPRTGPDAEGFYEGFGKTSTQVLIPAFIAAYTGQNPEDVTLDLIPNIFTKKESGGWRINIMPNWRITYDGLKKVKFFKKYFKNITIGHTYRSNYSVGSFSSNSFYREALTGEDFVNEAFDNEYNFYGEYDVNSISISEQFSPLINIDMTWKNSLLTRVEIKRQRNLSLSFSNNWLTEVSQNEYVVGLGYRIKDLKIQINNKPYVSDLNLRADLTISDKLTVMRKLVEDIDEITAGGTKTTIKISADYVLSERFNIKAFYDMEISKPQMSNSYPQTHTNFGITVRFTLSQ